ncbi:MAG TPA: hypothetical protein VN864_06425 [Thermoplasmata archaeon]|nr:hypothetical protein [Thermoplasmata archaeon]
MPPAASGGGSFELVSGPDLGGGFLHQLTVERFSGVNRFVYHAQDGGADANGPPKGNPEPFGWRLSGTMCPIGGRTCWHREFTLPIEESLRVRTAYNRTRFVMDAMLGHEYGGVPRPFEAAIEELVDRLGAVEGLPWYVGGSAGLWLRGAPVVPHDIDLGTTPEAVARIGEALKDFVTEPAAPTEWGGRPMLAARAFVGTVRNGVLVEWGVPAGPGEWGRENEWTAVGHRDRPDPVEWRSRSVPVLRPEWTLVRWAETGRTDQLAIGVAWLRQYGVDRGILDRALEASTLRLEARRDLARRIGPG